MYLTNKEFLAAIDESKQTYCSFVRPEYARYDHIVHAVTEITPEVIQATREKRASEQMSAVRVTQKNAGVPIKARTAMSEANADDIPIDGLVFRVMTSQHVPLDPDRKSRSRTAGKTHARTNFPPFVHYAFIDGALQEVGRSHWTGSLSNGYFTAEGGQMKRKLAAMFMLLVDRYAKRPNWRNYSYVEEMRSAALIHLCLIGLQFDESKSSNPFAFYTSSIHNCFLRVLTTEKKAQAIRDDLLIAHGATPSNTRVLEDSIAQQRE